MKMNNLYIFVILSYLQSVTFVTCGESDAMHIRSLRSSVFYKVVNYLTDKTHRNEVKVNSFNMSNELYYMHMFMASKIAEDTLSTVSTSNDNVESNVTGASLVLPMKKLDDMFAPTPISNVLDFVRSCYSQIAATKSNRTYIFIMKYADDEKINYELIKTTTEKFLRHTPKYSNLLLWEKRSNSDKLTNSLKYQRMACRNTTELNGMCDWNRLGLPANYAKNLCLYKLTHTQRFRNSPY
ncbi:hypothetical protein KSF78_0001529 [Schistosoma japonicum]|nr:hypothetical protein KSF78_0001529 [Schistosoma japonicum]